MSSTKKSRIIFYCNKEQKRSNQTTNGEYYVSLSYKNLISKKKKIMIYPIKYFMQWGTPSDLEDFNWYSDVFENINNKTYNI